jgi:hypothetical protein
MRESMCKEVMMKSETNSTIEGGVSGMTNKLKEDYVYEYLETQNMVSLKVLLFTIILEKTV